MNTVSLGLKQEQMILTTWVIEDDGMWTIYKGERSGRDTTGRVQHLTARRAGV